MPDDTIARAMSHIDSTADERDELRVALDSMTDERDAALFEVARLTTQFADADRRLTEAVAFAIRTGRVLRASDPHGALIARYRFAAKELEEFSDLNELPAHSSWCPDMLRAEADRLEANP